MCAMGRRYCLSEHKSSSVLHDKQIKIVKQLSTAAGAAKHSKLLAVVAARNSSETVIWSLITDWFGRKTAQCRPVDSILTPTTLSWIYTMRMEGLSTNGIPPEPLEWTKNSVLGAFLRDFLVILRVGSGDLWRKWHDFEVVLTFRDPK